MSEIEINLKRKSSENNEEPNNKKKNSIDDELKGLSPDDFIDKVNTEHAT